MPVPAQTTVFDPSSYATFRFTGWRFDEASATTTLAYALDDAVAFEERIELPSGAPALDDERRRALEAVLDLLHLVAGVSYYKTAAPERIAVDTGRLSERRARFLTDVYVQGLGEYAFRNGIDVASRVRFAGDPAADPEPVVLGRTGRSLVPVGGGKDSVVALETMRGAGADVTLFSVGDATPIAETARVAGLPRLIARRTLAPELLEANAAGALNGHVPVTAVVSLIAIATAILHGLDEVVLANERSASQGNLHWEGLDVNHQWSKGLGFERALRDLLTGEVVRGVDYFSLLRPASELAIARAFARHADYHHVFTSCNRAFRLDERRRTLGWCCECPKCRFVFLALAPWSEPEHLRGVFGEDLLDDPAQTAGFLALCALDEHKPFECVGEEEESIAAFRMLAADERWAGHAVVRAVGDRLPPAAGDPGSVLALSDDHEVPDRLLPAVHARLGA
jgi:hypothetical protein